MDVQSRLNAAKSDHRQDHRGRCRLPHHGRVLGYAARSECSESGVQDTVHIWTSSDVVVDLTAKRGTNILGIVKGCTISHKGSVPRE
jgi:hypothetical protein